MTGQVEMFPYTGSKLISYGQPTYTTTDNNPRTYNSSTTCIGQVSPSQPEKKEDSWYSQPAVSPEKPHSTALSNQLKSPRPIQTKGRAAKKKEHWGAQVTSAQQIFW